MAAKKSSMDKEQRKLAAAGALLSASDQEVLQIRKRGVKRACALANSRIRKAMALVKASAVREVCFSDADFKRRMPRAYTSDDGTEEGVTCVSKGSLAAQAEMQIEQYESEEIGCITKATARTIPRGKVYQSR